VRFPHVGSTECAPRSPGSAPLRSLWSPRRHALRPLPRARGLPARARVRALWRAHRLAGRALPRVLGPSARVRLRARRRRLPRAGASPGRGLEGARPARPRLRGGRRHREYARTARRRRARLRSARWRSQRQAWPPPGRAAGGRARRPLGAPRALPARTDAHGETATRADSRGATQERCGSVSGGVPGTWAGRPGRRRLHDRCNGLCGVVGAAWGRRAACRRRHFRANRPVTAWVMPI
jgi:hypothetical protein